MRLLLILLVLFLGCENIQAQKHCVTGKVTDKNNGKPLAFVNIVNPETNTGAASDIDGKFKICSSVPVKSLKFSYIGYEPEIVQLSGEEEALHIKMLEKEYDLDEIEVFPTENPAHRIINNVIINRNINNPEQLPEFSYTSYDKMIFNPESGYDFC